MRMNRIFSSQFQISYFKMKQYRMQVYEINLLFGKNQNCEECKKFQKTLFLYNNIINMEIIWQKDSKASKKIFSSFFLLISLLFCIIELGKGNNSNQTEKQFSNHSTYSEILSEGIQTSGSTISSPVWLQGSAVQMQKFLSDDYNYYITTNGNKVWACSMSLAWNQLKQSLLNGNNPQFQNMNELQSKIVQNFNSQLFTKKQLSEKSYYVYSGYGQQAIDKINLEKNNKFPQCSLERINALLTEKDFISYAYFYKKFSYPCPFESTQYFYFKSNKTNGFKAISSKQRKNIYYKYYNSRNDFLVGIDTTNPNEEILLMRSSNLETEDFLVGKVIKMVSMYSQLPNLRLGQFDSFAMPQLSFDYTRRFNQIEGLLFNNEQISGKRVSEMQQRLKLKMDNQGITVQNAAYIIVDTISFQEAKEFVLDNDFWLILKEKNKLPYLVMLVSSVQEVWSA